MNVSQEQSDRYAEGLETAFFAREALSAGAKTLGLLVEEGFKGDKPIGALSLLDALIITLGVNGLSNTEIRDFFASPEVGKRVSLIKAIGDGDAIAADVLAKDLGIESQQVKAQKALLQLLAVLSGPRPSYPGVRPGVSLQDILDAEEMDARRAQAHGTVVLDLPGRPSPLSLGAGLPTVGLAAPQRALPAYVPAAGQADGDGGATFAETADAAEIDNDE